MDVTVAGRRVTLRERLTLGEGYDLMGIIARANFDDLRTEVPKWTRMIESWEFEGDPSDPAAYEDLDVLTVLMPLSTQVNRHLNRLAGLGLAGDSEKN